MTQSKLWYVAYVHSCRERKSAEELSLHGIECYVPVRKELRQWSDRKKVVERLVLPRMVFIHCTPQERIALLAFAPSITRYMSEGGPYKPVVVPDDQMDTFRKMVDYGDTDLCVTSREFGPGDKVEVVGGPLKGLECELVSVSGNRCLAVRLGAVGTAIMDIPAEYLKLKETE